MKRTKQKKRKHIAACDYSAATTAGMVPPKTQQLKGRAMWKARQQSFADKSHYLCTCGFLFLGTKGDMRLYSSMNYKVDVAGNPPLLIKTHCCPKLGQHTKLPLFHSSAQQTATERTVLGFSTGHLSPPQGMCSQAQHPGVQLCLSVQPEMEGFP